MTQEDIEYQTAKNWLDMHDRIHPSPGYDLEEAFLLVETRDYANSTPVDWDWFSDSDQVETKQLEDYDISVLSVQGGRDYLLKRRIAPTKYFERVNGKIVRSSAKHSKYFLPQTVPVNSHQKLNRLLTKLELRMASLLVHGSIREEIEDADKVTRNGKQLIRRTKSNIKDTPKRWIMLDVEKLPTTELVTDWRVDPAGAVREAMEMVLPT